MTVKVTNRVVQAVLVVLVGVLLAACVPIQAPAEMGSAEGATELDNLFGPQ